MRRLVSQIPPAGGWKQQAAGQSFQDLATKLRDYGVPADDVVEILVQAYEAAERELRP